MCGIAGAIGYIDPSDRPAVERMTRAQTHRGPDDEGLWSSLPPEASGPGVVFGHRRLSILDLSPLGHQPMVDPSSGCVICFNGEVYNFQTLRAELEADGETFRSSCDTEVILKGYARWGQEVVPRLRGMFALALWDPARRQVLLARDRLGKKPLYWALMTRGAGQRTLYFASEVRALLASERLARRLDPVGLASFVWNGFPVGPSTIVAGVALLGAASMARVGLDDPAPEVRRFWSLPRAEPSPRAEEAVEEAGARLAEAVSLRLVSDVPLAVFLSGGIDSSAVAALAMRSCRGPVRTFNVAFEESRYDESSHARAVASALGTAHEEVRLTETTFRQRIQPALRSLDQPTFDGINTYFVSHAVREAGIKVALAGTGGDELFGGYSSFADLPRARRWARALAPAPAPLLRALSGLAVSVMVGRGGAVPPQTRWGKLADALATRGDWVGLYQTSYGLFTRRLTEALSPVSRGAAVRSGLPFERADELEALTRASPALHAVSNLELSCYLGERLLRDTDAASMAVSLEARTPLLDHVFVEALARVPLARRFLPLRRKQLLRDLALAALPPSLFDRPKAGFELPLALWSRRGLQTEIADTLADQGLAQRVGLDAQVVGSLWQAFVAGAPGIYWTRIWALYVFFWWCREHRMDL